MNNFTKLLFLASSLIISCNIKAKQNKTEVHKQEVADIPKLGTIDYLIFKNGFKIFQLGIDIKEYSNIIKPLETKKNLYVVTDRSLLSIGNNIKLKEIFIYTENNYIDRIFAVADSIYANSFFNTLVAAYGEPDKYNSWSYKSPNTLLLYLDEENDNNDVVVIFKRDKNITYSKLKEIRKIESEAIKYIKDL